MVKRARGSLWGLLGGIEPLLGFSLEHGKDC